MENVKEKKKAWKTLLLVFLLLLFAAGIFGVGTKILLDRQKGVVTVKYVDTEGNILAENTLLQDVSLNVEKSIEAKEIAHYKVVGEEKQNVLLSFANRKKEIVFEYTLADGVVLVSFVDAEGNKITEDKYIAGIDKGKETVIPAEKIAGYAMVQNGDAKITLSEDKPSGKISLVYVKVEGKVHVKYVDVHGKKIAEERDICGLDIDKNIEIHAKEINGYAVNGEKTQIVRLSETENSKDVTFTYSEILGSVTVKYETEDGKKLRKENVVNGLKIGKPYLVKAPHIRGYTLVSDMVIDVTVTALKKDKEVTLIYKKAEVSSGNSGNTGSANKPPKPQVQQPQVEVTPQVPQVPQNPPQQNPPQQPQKPPVLSGRIVVEYVDKQGNKLAKDTVIPDVKFGVEKEVVPVEIKGYAAPASQKVTLKEGTQSYKVTFVYANVQGEVIVKYLDAQDLPVLAEQKITKVEIGVEKVITAKDVPYYSVVGESSKKVTLSEKNKTQTVIFRYARKEGTVTVKYVDAQGVELAKSLQEKIPFGQKKAYTAKKIEGYTLQGQSSKEVFLEDKTPQATVVFTYTKDVTEGTVTVRYVDAKGNALADNKVLANVPYGVEQTVTALDILHYTPDKKQEKVTLSKEKPQAEILFTYTRNTGIVTVKYVDSKGVEIAPSMQETVEHGVEKTYIAKEIAGYVPSSVTTQKVTLDAKTPSKTVTFTYKKEKTEGTVTVRYLGEDGRDVIPEENVTAKYGVATEIVAKNIPGYIVVGENKKTVTLSKLKPQETVIFRYKREKGKVIIKYLNENNMPVLPQEEIEVEFGEETVVTAKQVAEYDVVGKDIERVIVTREEKTKTVIFKYAKTVTHGTVTVKYQDASGVKLAEDTVMQNVRVGDVISLQAKQIAEYTPDSEIKKVTLERDNYNKTVIFVYSKKQGRVTVRHALETDITTPVIPDVVENLEYGVEKIYRAQNVPGYTLHPGVSATEKVVLSEAMPNATVLFLLDKVQGKVTVKYMYADGSEAKAPLVETVDYGVTKTYKAPSIPGYYPDATEKTVTVTEGNLSPVVTFTYSKEITSGNITVEHVNAKGEKIAKDIVMQNVPYGKVQVVTPENIAGYRAPSAQQVTLSKEKPHATVRFAYTDISGKVIVKHLGKNGDVLSQEETFADLEIGVAKTVHAKQIPNYKVEGNASVTVTPAENKKVHTVTFTYARKTGTVTVKYMYADGREAKAPLVETVEYGVTKKYTAPEIAGYTPDAAVKSVTLGEENGSAELLFTYAKKTGRIVVRYLDASGQKVAEDLVMQNVELGKPVTVNAKEIATYEIVGERSYTVTLLDNKLEELVTFIYQKEKTHGTVTVKYQDANGAKLAEDAVLANVPFGIEKSISPISINGYITPAAKKVTLSKSRPEETVIFVYAKEIKSGNITVECVDTAGSVLPGGKVITAEYGKKVVVTAPTVKGYTVQGTSSVEVTLSDAMPEKKVTFTYVKEITSGSITVISQDASGVEIAREERKNIPLDVEQTIAAPTHSGYTLASSAVQKVTVTKINPHRQVIFTYNKVIPKGSIVVKYVNEAKQEIAPSKLVQDVTIGVEHVEEAIKVKNHTLVSTSPAKVTLSEAHSTQEIVFVYREILGKINIKYVDASGHSVANTEVLENVKLDVAKTVASKKIVNYELVDKVEKTVTCTENVPEQTVTFTYREILGSVTVTHKDSLGVEVAPAEVKSGLKLGVPHTIPSASVKNYEVVGEKVKLVTLQEQNKDVTVNFVYNKITGEITVRYVNSAGQNVREPLVMQGVELDVVTRVEAPLVTGFVVTGNSFVDVTLDMQKRKETVTFTYKEAYIQNMQVQHINYKDTLEVLQNPDRGFYRQAECKLQKDGTYSAEELVYAVAEAKAESSTLVHVNIDIGILSGKMSGTNVDREFTQKEIENLDTVMQVLRENKLKGIVRFAYLFPGTTPDSQLDQIANKEPQLDVILRHVAQLQPFFAKNKDVITVVDAGFFGPWGEMHTSKIVTPANVKRLQDALCTVIPQDIMINTGTPQLYREVYGAEPVTKATAYNGSNRSRVGFFDDSFMSSADDRGFYVDRKTDLAWLKEHAKYTFFGGESSLNSQVSDAANVGTEVYSTHPTYLNSGYHLDVIAKWKREKYVGDNAAYAQKSVYDYMQNSMGYRFLVTNSVIHDKAMQGGEFAVNLDIQNVGLSNSINKRVVKLLLKQGDNYYETLLDLDPRNWETGTVTQNNFVMSLPSTIPVGKWDIYVKVVDKYADRYTVRFANGIGTWEETLEANHIGAITVTENASSGVMFVQKNNKLGDTGTDTMHSILDIPAEVVVDGKITTAREWTDADIVAQDATRKMYAKTQGDNLFVYVLDNGSKKVDHTHLRTGLQVTNPQDISQYAYGIEDSSLYKLDVNGDCNGTAIPCLGLQVTKLNGVTFANKMLSKNKVGTLGGNATAVEYKIPLQAIGCADANALQALSYMSLQVWDNNYADYLVKMYR